MLLIVFIAPARGAVLNEFVTTWDTTRTTTGSSGSSTVVLPLQAAGTYNFDADWGDQTTSHVTSYTQGTHTYASPGTYTVRITGTISGFNFYENAYVERLKLMNVSHWGPLTLGSGSYAFAGAENMTITATDAPDLSQTTSLNRTFSGAKALTGGVGNWDIHTITDLSDTFEDAWYFNEDLSGWDTGQVTSMYETFYHAVRFNGDVSTWDVADVTNMNGMFEGASSFNRDLSSWNMTGARDVTWMFSTASSFNQDISAWDMSNVTNLTAMFQLARAFNQDIGTWNTSRVTSMSATFAGASAFNQNLGPWDVHAVTTMSQMLRDSGLRAPNYDRILVSWAAQDVKNSVGFWGNSKYASDAAVAARAHLTGTHTWSINDGGRAGLPLAPTGVTAAAGNRTIDVAWTDPAMTNFVPNDQFTATADPGGQTCVATTSGCRITGLTNGVGYTVSVVVTSAVGTGPASTPSETVVPLGLASAPRVVTATPGHRQITVAWSPPADNGGAPVTRYTVTARPGGATCTTTAARCVVRGLANATTYALTLVATTQVGNSPAAVASATTQPAWPQTASFTVPKRVSTVKRTVLLSKAVVTNAGQKATATVQAPPRKAKVRTNALGKIVVIPRTTKRFTLTLRLSAPATADHAVYSFSRQWRAR